MKNLIRVTILLFLLVAVLLPGTALAQAPGGNKLVLGGIYSLKSGETLNGNLIVLGGMATLQEGSRVNGDVLVAGGTLDASGTVNGNVYATGGLVTLNESAIVTGDVTTLGAHLERSPQAQVQGSLNTNNPESFQLTIPGGIRIPRMPFTLFSINPFARLFFGGIKLFGTAFVWAILAFFVVLLAPKATKRVAETVVSQPLLSGGVGFLTVIAFPLLMVMLVFTIILIPVSILGLILLWVVWMYGTIAVGTEVGERIAVLFKADWAIPVSAGLGTFLLILLVNTVDIAIPCVGWVPRFIVAFLGIGAALLTRFGSQAYPPAAVSAAGEVQQLPPQEPPQESPGEVQQLPPQEPPSVPAE